MVVARYCLASTQSIYDATNTRVIWNSKQFDSAKDLDPTKGMDTTTGIYTCGEAGYYDFAASVGLGNSQTIYSNNRTATYYKKNGGPLKKISGKTFAGTFYETAQWYGGDLVYLDVGDTLEIIVYLDFGTNTYGIDSVNECVTFFKLFKL